MQRRILCIRSDRLGEFLLTLYAIKIIKINYPESKLYLLAKEENIELIKGTEFIDEFLFYQKEEFRGLRGAFKLAGIIKEYSIDTVVVFNPQREFHLASFLGRASLRVGYDRKWGFCLNKKITDRKHLSKKHEAEYNIDLVRLICKDTKAPSLEFPFDKRESLHFLDNKLFFREKYVVIHPFSSHQAKRIEKEFWHKLIEKINEKIKNKIVIIGTEEDKEESVDFIGGLKVINLVGRLTLRNLAVFFKYYCGVFIGLDSGPMHLASIFKRPVVGLFKVTSPYRWGPYKTISLVIEGEKVKDFLDKIEDILSFISSQKDCII